MNSKTYMRSAEFKERQGSFGFFYAAAAEYLAKFRDECRKGWAKLFKNVKAKFENITLPLPFDQAHRATQIKKMAEYLFDLDSFLFILGGNPTKWEIMAREEGKRYCKKRHRKPMSHRE